MYNPVVAFDLRCQSGICIHIRSKMKCYDACTGARDILNDCCTSC